MLTQWFLGDVRIDVGQRLEMSSAEEIRVIARFDQRQPQIAQASRRAFGEREAGETLEGMPAPQRQGAFERARRSRRLALPECVASVTQQRFGGEQIGFLGPDFEAVAAGLRDDPVSVLFEPAAQPGHDYLQRGERKLRRVVAPQLLGERACVISRFAFSTSNASSAR